MSDTPETDAFVADAEEMCLRAGLSGMEFWREMYGHLLGRMRRRETEAHFARPEEERGFYTKQGVHSVSDGKRYCTDCNRELYSDGRASLLPEVAAIDLLRSMPAPFLAEDVDHSDYEEWLLKREKLLKSLSPQPREVQK